MLRSDTVFDPGSVFDPGPARLLFGGAALLFGMVLIAACIGCSEPVTETAEAPVAGMEHPEVVKVGERVRFDAAGSWADAAGNEVPLDGGTLVRYEFLIADGSPANSTASAFIEHTFTQVGTFAVQVIAEDDLGRQSVARSKIHVAADYSPSCDAASAKSCTSGRCAGDRCAIVVCAGDKACNKVGKQSGAVACRDGLCVQP